MVSPKTFGSNYRKRGVANSSRSIEYADGNVLAVHNQGARKHDEMRRKYVFTPQSRLGPP